ncbi:hypothetical protein ACLB9Y_00940 [Chryseobacterium scophthalmum]|uniref:hypothetical protein n=1 Tax=Chryseobacterium scophthalmum TaxID=59733 RepID=UPI00398ABA01
MDTAVLRQQLDAIINAYVVMQGQSRHKDLSDLPQHERQSLVTRAISAIHRISGQYSTYSSEIDRILKGNPDLHLHTSFIIGITQALRDDLNLGYIQSLTEIVHAEVFSEFIDMAKHLCVNGYKDPAAVIAGSTLESHLKKLATKYVIPLEVADRPVKAEKLNQDLAKIPAYSLLDQKNVTAWLDLRNKAAHGNYGDYNIDQVKLLISSIQDFITRIPA